MAIFPQAVCMDRDCKFESPCSEIEMKKWTLGFDIFDDDSRNNYQLPFEKQFMVDGTTVNDPGACYFPIFMTQSDFPDSSWYIGTTFVKFFYLSFDQSTYSQRRYIQIGIAPINPSEVILDERYKNEEATDAND